MKKLLYCTLTLLMFLLQAQGQGKRIFNETEEEKEKRLGWWRNDRFGMFIHWGIYALSARNEWVKHDEQMTDSVYHKYFENFNPDLYDPRQWARMAKAAGMKYIVITTKHHDGFCLFDSEYTDYKATKTAAKKDLIKEWVDAVRAEGLKVGLYYSLIDWHHPDFTIDRIHPQHPDDIDNADEEYEKLNKGRDMAKYRTYLHNQVKEVMTKYGKIDLLWTDFSYPTVRGKNHNDWNSLELIKTIRKLQPDIIINDRLDLGEYEDGYDFVTPEQYKVTEWPTRNGKKVPWETCQTFSGSWGYHRDETSWKDNKQLLVLLIETVSKGGNLLLNVGPTSRGLFDSRAQDRLYDMGKWMKVNGRSIYGCTQVPEGIQRPENTLLTYNPETRHLYVHLLDYPLQRIALPGLKGKVKYAQFLHDGSELKMSITDEGVLVLEVPVRKPDVEIPVIELVLK